MIRAANTFLFLFICVFASVGLLYVIDGNHQMPLLLKFFVCMSMGAILNAFGVTFYLSRAKRKDW